MKITALLCAALAATLSFGTQAEDRPTTAEVMASLTPSDWREPKPANLMYITTPRGEVIIELAPTFAPNHVENIRTLIKERYFDGLAVIRSHDNYVAQWGDPNFDDKSKTKSLGSANAQLNAEIYRPIEDANIAPIDSRDAYADHVGFSDGFPVGYDDKQAWMLHCYGVIGVARDMDINSGNGAMLYAVTGHAPRHLDKNLTMVGRVLAGIEHLSSLPRGTGTLGFYETTEEREPLLKVRLGSELKESERTRVKVLRTDTDAFQRWVDSRRFRIHEFFHDPGGRIGIGNIHPPVEKI